MSFLRALAHVKKVGSSFDTVTCSSVTQNVKSIPEIIALEKSEDLSLSEAALVHRWEAGYRDEETALRLAFIEWWACCEPRFLTGLENGAEITSKKGTHFDDCFDLLLPSASPRILFVIGWMSTMFPWCCRRETRDWAAIGKDLLNQFDAGPDLRPDDFEVVSTFGDYFSEMLARRLKK